MKEPRAIARKLMLAAAAGIAAATAVALEPVQFVAGWPIEAPQDADVFDVPQ